MWGGELRDFCKFPKWLHAIQRRDTSDEDGDAHSTAWSGTVQQIKREVGKLRDEMLLQFRLEAHASEKAGNVTTDSLATLDGKLDRLMRHSNVDGMPLEIMRMEEARDASMVMDDGPKLSA